MATKSTTPDKRSSNGIDGAEKKQAIKQKELFRKLDSLNKLLPLKKKGPSQAAFYKLLPGKLGFTEKELKEIRKTSLENAKIQSRKLHDEMKGTKTDFKKIVDRGFFPPGSFSTATYFMPEEVPSLPANIFIPSDNPEQHGHAFALGDGDGWVTQRWGGNADQYGYVTARFVFPFTPPVPTYYSFDAAVTAVGRYFILADDWAFVSKEAYISITIDMKLEQKLPEPWFPLDPSTVNEEMDTLELFHEGDDNIERSAVLNAKKTANIEHVFLYAGAITIIEVTVSCVVMAKGGGSEVYLDLEGTQGGILCPGLLVRTV